MEIEPEIKEALAKARDRIQGGYYHAYKCLENCSYITSRKFEMEGHLRRAHSHEQKEAQNWFKPIFLVDPDEYEKSMRAMYKPCACQKFCGDVDEPEDGPQPWPECKKLPYPRVSSPVEIVLIHRDERNDIS